MLLGGRVSVPRSRNFSDCITTQFIFIKLRARKSLLSHLIDLLRSSLHLCAARWLTVHGQKCLSANWGQITRFWLLLQSFTLTEMSERVQILVKNVLHQSQQIDERTLGLNFAVQLLRVFGGSRELASLIYHTSFKLKYTSYHTWMKMQAFKRMVCSRASQTIFV